MCECCGGDCKLTEGKSLGTTSAQRLLKEILNDDIWITVNTMPHKINRLNDNLWDLWRILRKEEEA